jgi:hypothetical protein
MDCGEVLQQLSQPGSEVENEYLQLRHSCQSGTERQSAENQSPQGFQEEHQAQVRQVGW